MGFVPAGGYFTGPIPAITASGTVLSGAGAGDIGYGSTIVLKPGGNGDLLTVGKFATVRDLGLDGNYFNQTVAGRGIVVTDGVAAGDKVVVTGAQQLLATELLGSAGGTGD